MEVNYNGEWGTVCDDGWDDTDAGVVCRQLGFGSSGTAIGSARLGQGSGSIWLDSVTCAGSESTLASCGHLGVGINRSCSHFEDAGVRCSTTGIEKSKTRLLHRFNIILFMEMYCFFSVMQFATYIYRVIQLLCQHTKVQKYFC